MALDAGVSASQGIADFDIGDEAASRSGAHGLASRDAFHGHLRPRAVILRRVDRHRVDHGRRTVRIMRPEAVLVIGKGANAATVRARLVELDVGQAVRAGEPVQLIRIDQRVLILYCNTVLRELDLAGEASTSVEASPANPIL